MKNSFYVDLLWENENLATSAPQGMMKVLLQTQFWLY